MKHARRGGGNKLSPPSWGGEMGAQGRELFGKEREGERGIW